MRVLMIDVGGTNVKLMVSGNEEMRKFRSGPKLSAEEMIAGVKVMTTDWEYDAITLGFPGLVEEGQLRREPLNLGGGWVQTDISAAFDRPLRIINDAALQALGVYDSGRMLFIGFGTSIGATLVADDVIVPIELGLIPFNKGGLFMTELTKAARKEHGQKRWQRRAEEAVVLLQDVFWPHETVIGGGNAKHVEPLPDRCRRSCNANGLIGAERMWPGAGLLAEPYGTTWRIKREAAQAVLVSTDAGG